MDTDLTARVDTRPWVEKYRPERLEDLVAHEEIISILNRLMDENKMPHLLFYGPPGTGKTSTILACAKRLYGAKYASMTLELNASDDRGIDVVRNEIKEFAGTKRLFSTGVKLVILDEADAMTSDAQFALRRVIEKYTQNTRFCLICNYVSKIIPALQSRCTKFRFAPLKPEQIRDRLGYVVQREGVKITPSGTEALLRLSEGDMRRVLNLLQATSMANDEVNEEAVYLCAGSPLPSDIDFIVQLLLESPFKEAFKMIHRLTTEKGYSLSDIITYITEAVIKMELPPLVLCNLLDTLSNVEYRLASATNDKLQLGSLVGAFALARSAMTP